MADRLAVRVQLERKMLWLESWIVYNVKHLLENPAQIEAWRA